MKSFVSEEALERMITNNRDASCDGYNDPPHEARPLTASDAETVKAQRWEKFYAVTHIGLQEQVLLDILNTNE